MENHNENSNDMNELVCTLQNEDENINENKSKNNNNIKRTRKDFKPCVKKKKKKKHNTNNDKNNEKQNRNGLKCVTKPMGIMDIHLIFFRKYTSYLCFSEL